MAGKRAISPLRRTPVRRLHPNLREDRRLPRYFEEQVLRKRPYIQREWCERALREPVERQFQLDGRVCYGVFIPELGKYLRVVTPENGETVHNAFPDRDFEEVQR